MEVFEKSETVDPEVRAYVYSLVSAVGGSSSVDDGRYTLGDDALACLKDLKKWLNLYDNKYERFDVKRCLAEANLVKGDLLEILASWQEDSGSALRRKVALACLELLGDLTWPLTRTDEQTKVNHHRHMPYLQLAQVDYKRAILEYEDADIFRKTIAVAVPAMTTPRKERQTRDEGIINLLLYLFRNIAIISQPQHLPSRGDDNEVSRAATIQTFDRQNVLQLLLTISSNMGEDFVNQDVIMLEILFHLLKGVDPKKIFREEKQVMDDNTQSFKKLLQKEKAMFAADAKNAPTRHNRFGTMIWVKRGDDKVSTLTGQDVITSDQKTLQKMDETKIWNKPKYRAKKVERPGESTDFVPIHVDAKARSTLRTFVSDFLDSSFNPLFTHLRRAIEREVERVKDSHKRQYFYLTAWFLKAEEARRHASPQTNIPSQEPGAPQETSFPYIAGVLTQENFVLLNRTMQRNIDDKSWSDVHTCILAFTQTLLTVSDMAESPSEDDQEIAENILSRIFYEETTHDRVIQVLRGYKEGLQGFGYLDACTEMAHVFLRLLERYSKVNVDMHIRSKRRARGKVKAKAKEAPQVEIEGLNESQEAESEVDHQHNDEVEAHREVQERKFDFVRFAARFVNETCINTFVHLASYYSELTTEQLKRCHRFFYRVAFKMEQALLLFRIDTLNLFNKMVKGPDGLDASMDRKSDVFKEWEELVRQIFRRCIKKLGERPELMVEMLFSKIPNTLFFLDHGYDKEIVKSAPRPPAELEVKSGMTAGESVGVAVSLLVNQGKLDAVAWVKTVLANASEERKSWEYQQVALQSIEAPDSLEETPTVDEPDKPRAPSIVVRPDNEERKVALFKDKHLRLLLKTLAFERMGAIDEPDASWIIPSSLTGDELQENLDVIKKCEFDPPTYEDGKSAEDMTRNVSAARRNAYEKEASEDEGDSDIDEGLFVPGGPTAREADGDEGEQRPKKRRLKRAGGDREISEEERKRRSDERRRKEKEKDSKVKSALFVTDSDDEEDETRDADFFRLEAERRGQARGAIKAALMKESVVKPSAEHIGGRKGKRKSAGGVGKEAKKRRKENVDSDMEDAPASDVDVEDEPMVISSRESSEAPDSDMDESSDVENEVDADEEDETPLSSQARPTEAAVSKVLTETDGNRGRPVDADEAGEAEEDDDGPVIKTVRRRAAPFVIDDSDSE